MQDLLLFLLITKNNISIYGRLVHAGTINVITSCLLFSLLQQKINNLEKILSSYFQYVMHRSVSIHAAAAYL